MDSKARSKDWHAFVKRRQRLLARHGDVEKHMALRALPSFQYTAAEQSFCARFDALSVRWDEGQQALADFEGVHRCAACDELRPQWLPGAALRLTVNNAFVAARVWPCAGMARPVNVSQLHVDPLSPLPRRDPHLGSPLDAMWRMRRTLHGRPGETH